MSCRTNYNIKDFGTCNLDRLPINGADRTVLNWTEVPVTEILPVPIQKPNIESVDQVYVDAKITSIKLIETPFSYREYNRPLTAPELEIVQDALALATISPALLTAVTTAVNAILAVPGLAAVPGVGPLLTAVQDSLTAVTTASTNLTTTITNATAVLVDGVLACLAVSALRAIETSLIVLRTSLNTLLAAVRSLVTFVSTDPVVGPLVTPLLGAVVTSVNAVLAVIVSALNAILEAISLINLAGTKYFEITPNAEGTCLSGRKLIIEGTLNQKIVYTGLVTEQSVHSAHYTMPFSAFIIPYAKFEGLTYQENVEVIDANGDPVIINGFPFNPDNPIVPDLCEEFSVKSFIEDIFAYALDERTIFKNVTLFLHAEPVKQCVITPVNNIDPQCTFINT